MALSGLVELNGGGKGVWTELVCAVGERRGREAPTIGTSWEVTGVPPALGEAYIASRDRRDCALSIEKYM